MSCLVIERPAPSPPLSTSLEEKIIGVKPSAQSCNCLFVMYKVASISDFAFYQITSVFV